MKFELPPDVHEFLFLCDALVEANPFTRKRIDIEERIMNRPVEHSLLNLSNWLDRQKETVKVIDKIRSQHTANTL